MTAFTFEPIGRVHSCFKEKFGIPRQPGLVPEAQARLEIFPPFDREEAFRGLKAFSHIWILFAFHQCRAMNRQTTVRPPRLGGNQRIGVFASRSGFRPNPIGQSVVELTGILKEKNRFDLLVKGIDLLDGTPVLDIKPYLPYADIVSHAKGGYAVERPNEAYTVDFSADAGTQTHRLEQERHPGLKRLITRLLSLDPRPAYRSAGKRREAIRYAALRSERHLFD